MNVIRQLKVKNFIALFIAGIINAFGVTVFLAPVKLYDSGISGTSMLLAQVTPLQFLLENASKLSSIRREGSEGRAWVL